MSTLTESDARGIAELELELEGAIFNRGRDETYDEEVQWGDYVGEAAIRFFWSGSGTASKEEEAVSYSDDFFYALHKNWIDLRWDRILREQEAA